jgi:pimeloyl-ACP methyl ester carboxylesterase
MALLPLAGFAYQRAGRMLDRRRLQSPGRLLHTGKSRWLYLVEKGHGRPTVVFEAGFAATSLNWTVIQRAVAEFAHTVSYDRYGLGWSSAVTTERTPKQIVGELRQMLGLAGMSPPYVLVGHSYGGLVMRRYALDYPEETAGVVLVDPMRTSEWPPVDERQSAIIGRAKCWAGYAVNLARFGVVRLAARLLLGGPGKVRGRLLHLTGRHGRDIAVRIATEVGKMPREIWPAIASHWSDPHFYRGVIAQINGLTRSVTEMHDARPIRGVPVLVLTPGSAARISEDEMGKLGQQSRQVIAHKSKHWVHLDEPELVVSTILEMFSEASI